MNYGIFEMLIYLSFFFFFWNSRSIQGYSWNFIYIYIHMYIYICFRTLEQLRASSSMATATSSACIHRLCRLCEPSSSPWPQMRRWATTHTSQSTSSMASSHRKKPLEKLEIVTEEPISELKKKINNKEELSSLKGMYHVHTSSQQENRIFELPPSLVHNFLVKYFWVILFFSIKECSYHQVQFFAKI